MIRFILALGNVHRRALARLYWVLGARFAYWFSTLGARLIYWLLPPLQLRSEALCYAALHDSHTIDEIRAIARQSFLNRTLNTTDLILARHRLTAKNYARMGGALPAPQLSDIRAKQRTGKPIILVTAYFGSFDLLPILLGYNDVAASVVYLPHLNKGFDRFRRSIRGKSGSELVAVDDAGARFQDVLAAGGTIGVVADHHVTERAVPVKFFGIDTSVPRSIGLLAWRYNAEVAVAGI
ncbi:MAG: lysophospholipid acyltransferase family protein, partial [Phycisphaerae bacterium]